MYLYASIRAVKYLEAFKCITPRKGSTYIYKKKKKKDCHGNGNDSKKQFKILKKYATPNSWC